jgi:7,8-dihydropterin-6-yl-methyl-4-(beta-D-ribofuranosyl)aminobenzene 5'-phosphate synthase
MGIVFWILAFMVSAVTPTESRGFGEWRGSEVSMSSGDVDSGVVADDITITVLYDNASKTEGLKPAWGFSCLVRTSNADILFDCGGDGNVLLSNMKKLQVDPDSIQTVVLSHEHWDHVGGLAAVLENRGDVQVFMLHSFPDRLKSDVRSHGADIVEVTDSRQIARGVYSTGEMGDAIKEQSLIIRAPDGLIIVTGCAHPGIVDIVTKAVDLFGGPVRCVLGGFHLLRASKTRIRSIVQDFRDSGVRYVAPCHCSGESAIALLKAEFGKNFIEVGVGSVIRLSDLRQKAASDEQGEKL